VSPSQSPKVKNVPNFSLLGGLSAERFLGEHWQKKPLLVRGAFPDFRDPITPEELAGLSCEDGVESRLVRELPHRKKRPWEVTWGPQQRKVFASLPERKWTLLVQEVNRWVPQTALLLDRFAFLPNVRVDDVMVSFAAPGGSVGPHLDSYDAFLVQGQGKRRWKFHDKPTKKNDKLLIEGIDLRVLARFKADVDEVLGPGDMLYLPPGFAHHGVAVTPCLTYSVGFRSPSAGEAWSSFASALASRPQASRLLEDPSLAPAKNPGAIPPELLLRVRTMIRSMDISDDTIDRWFAAFATQLHPGHSLEAPRRPLDERTIMKRLERGDTTLRSEEGRWAFLERKRISESEPEMSLCLYIGGNEIEVAPAAADLARTLCAGRRHQGTALQKQTRSRAARTLLVHLFAIGALRFS
jgi:50S ribosomal protein L16 3-hydroxylase